MLYLWSRCWLLCVGARLRVHGREHLGNGGACVVVSNHQSNLDPIVYLALSRGSLRIMTKRELFDVPILGAALIALGMVKVDRLTPDRATIQDESARTLAEGVPLLVFPEGTTSRRGELLPFRAGAFEVAVASQVPIVPACVLDTRDLWPAKRLLIRPGTVHVIISEPESTTGLAQGDVAALRARVVDRIRTTYCSYQGTNQPAPAGSADTRKVSGT
ncbi:lysophospholipid acyltransferase family protein [Nocardioides aurantiacus]|uniref:lysophospholipid acyltransferase family protein n=1 Tax=Nocardioides aurantiacus TaxID=86796 RepID=UPI00403F9C32